MATDTHDDLALYRLPPGRYSALTLRAATPATAGEAVLLLGHRPGRAILASRGLAREPPARWQGQPILEYTAPAYDGYSGAPVLDAQGRVLGVHRGWDFRTLGHGELVAVLAAAVLEAFTTLQPEP